MSIPRTFCITLPEKPERTARAREHFNTCAVDNVEFFDGIDAQAFGLKTVFPYELDNPGSGFNIGFKPVGIWLSHRILWQVLLYQPESHFFILEDDANFRDDWKQKMKLALEETPPSFDWLFIGSCCTAGRRSMRVGGSVYQLNWPSCFHAYVIARKCIPYLLETTRKCYAPIDIHLPLHCFSRMGVYTVLPRLVDQFDTAIRD